MLVSIFYFDTPCKLTISTFFLQIVIIKGLCFNSDLLLIMAQVTLQPKPKIRQLKNFRKFESTTRRAEKCDNIWVTLPKYINRSKSTQLIRFNFWCILCGNKHEPKSGILLCFCHSTSANYWHATAANVCLFHPVSEMGKWIHANPECRFSKKTVAFT